MRIRTKKHRLPPAAYYGEVLVAVTACEIRRRPIFAETEIVSIFIKELEKAADYFSCSVPIYCFMPDHLHLIVKGKEQRSRPKLAVEKFKHQTGNWLHENRPEFEWQDDFYDHVIRRNEDWLAQVQYIAGNPFRAGLVEDIFAYPFTGSIGYDLRELLVFGL